MAAPVLVRYPTGQEYTVTGTRFTIGRAVGSSMIMDVLEISRMHCCIEKINDKWYISDLSSNGTSLNNIRLEKFHRHLIMNNDEIELSHNVKFKYKHEIKDMTPDNTILVIPDDSLEATEPEPLGTIKPDKLITVIPQPPQVAIAGSSSANSAMADEVTCSICTELYVKAVTLNCAHSFCAYCIREWRKTQNICPICRTKITSAQPTLGLDNIVSRLEEHMPDDEKTSRKELVKLREAESKAKSKPKRKITSAATRGRGRMGRRRRAPTAVVIEISTDEDIDDDDMDVDDMVEMMAEGFDDDSDDIHDNYYGGYGACYICNDEGHWANSCPLRRWR